MMLGVAPKELNWIRRRLLCLTTRPQWMRQHGASGLDWFLEAERDLKANGVVVPGVIIQANTLLFEPGPDDHPGELLYTLSDEPDLPELLRAAHEIYCWKGESSPVEEERFFSEYLGNELVRVLKVPVSSRFTSNPKTFVSTTIFYRKHLPGGILRQSVYPVLADPISGAAMVLPLDFWSTCGRATYERFLDPVSAD